MGVGFRVQGCSTKIQHVCDSDALNPLSQSRLQLDNHPDKNPDASAPWLCESFALMASWL